MEQKELSALDSLPERKNFLRKEEVEKYDTGVDGEVIKRFERSNISSKNQKRYTTYELVILTASGTIYSVDNIFRNDMAFDVFPKKVNIRAVKTPDGKYLNWKVTAI